jgi:hypothetical protein
MPLVSNVWMVFNGVASNHTAETVRKLCPDNTPVSESVYVLRAGSEMCMLLPCEFVALASSRRLFLKMIAAFGDDVTLSRALIAASMSFHINQAPHCDACTSRIKSSFPFPDLRLQKPYHSSNCVFPTLSGVVRDIITRKALDSQVLMQYTSVLLLLFIVLKSVYEKG